jgi:hypothetical protein
MIYLKDCTGISLLQIVDYAQTSEHSRMQSTIKHKRKLSSVLTSITAELEIDLNPQTRTTSDKPVNSEQRVNYRLMNLGGLWIPVMPIRGRDCGNRNARRMERSCFGRRGRRRIGVGWNISL